MTSMTASLADRAKAILTKPAAEWPVIAAEHATPAGLMTSWAVPLAAIGPVANFIHSQVFGYGAFGISYKPGLVAALSSAAVSYVLGLVGVFVLAIIADTLAPKFGGVSDRAAAFKLIVYGSTAAWLAGIFQLLPGLGIIGIVGLYSLYLYYLGATPVMKVPAERAAGYTAVTVICAILLYVVIGAVSSAFLGMFGGGLGSHVADSSGTVSGKLSIPGGGTVDVAAINKLGDQMKASQGKAPVAADKLQALLPASIGNYQRTAIESAAVGQLGSNADGTYTSGSNSFHLKVSDMAAVGALAGLGSAFGVSENKQDANGYEKTGTVDGHMQSEAWHNDSHSGKFSVIVGNRFAIEADGSAANVDELKAAVAAVDQKALKGMAG